VKAAAGAVLTMMLTSCAAAVPPPPAAGGDEVIRERGESGRRCDASKAQHLVGRAATKEAGAEALRLSGAGTMRWLPEGSVTTMEYRADRLNIHLDRANAIARIACG
jgi:hypothetical protein